MRSADHGARAGPRLDDDHVRVGEERHAVQPARRQRDLEEREIDISARDELCEGVGGVALLDRDDDVGSNAREGTKQRRHDPRGHVLRRRDPQRPRTDAFERSKISACCAHARYDRVGVSEENLARSGKRDWPRPARALDQPAAGEAFERSDLVTDRRLHVPETLRRTTERTLTGNGLERGEVPQLDPRPLLPRHETCDVLLPRWIGGWRMLNSCLTGVRPCRMAVTVDVELLRAGFGSDLSESLAAHGLQADLVEEEGTCVLHVTYARDEQERLLGDVAHAIEAWIGDKMLPLVVDHGNGALVVRPPAD